jgi:hypothetical protein
VPATTRRHSSQKLRGVFHFAPGPKLSGKSGYQQPHPNAQKPFKTMPLGVLSFLFGLSGLLGRRGVRGIHLAAGGGRLARQGFHLGVGGLLLTRQVHGSGLGLHIRGALLGRRCQGTFRGGPGVEICVNFVTRPVKKPAGRHTRVGGGAHVARLASVAISFLSLFTDACRVFFSSFRDSILSFREAKPGERRKLGEKRGNRVLGTKWETHGEKAKRPKRPRAANTAYFA